MEYDPLARYRKSPVSATEVKPPPREPEEYEAFGAKDRVNRLRIRSRTEPVNAPGYNILLNIIYDSEGTHFILVYSMLMVLVCGKHLGKVIFAIEHELADFIQEFDPQHWRKPSNATAPFIESIKIDRNIQAEVTKH
jgi:hypothetical protein